MALNIPQIADPRDPANPLRDAYGWLASLTLDMVAGSGRIAIRVHPNEAAWQADPVGSLSLALGQRGAPTLADLMADADFAAAFNTLGSKLYGLAVAHVPELAGATQA